MNAETWLRHALVDRLQSMLLLAAMGGFLALLGWLLWGFEGVVILIVAPHLSALAQLGLSRAREYGADLNAARLTGDPEGLARALVKLEQRHGGWWERVILPGRRVPKPSFLRTHPPTEERVRRLLELARPEREIPRIPTRPRSRRSPRPCAPARSSAPPAGT